MAPVDGGGRFLTSTFLHFAQHTVHHRRTNQQVVRHSTHLHSSSSMSGWRVAGWGSTVKLQFYFYYTFTASAHCVYRCNCGTTI